MKRLLFFAALIVTIGSFGGHIIAVHAETISGQTLTSTQTATLQQQLDVAKATLAQLEMQAGIVPPTDAGTPTTIPSSIAGASSSQTSATVATNSGLSANQITAFASTLSTLSAALTQLNTSLAVNATLAPSQAAAVATTLNGMRNTLVAMANTIATANNLPSSAPIATTQPGGTVAVNNTPATTVAPVTNPSIPTVAATPAPSTNTSVPQTAQASSLWSFTKAHWPTIVIVLLVIAILAILFWPEKETVRTVSTATSGSGKPKSAPTTTVTMNQQTNPNQPKPTMTSNSSTPPPATPVANAVAAPSQK